MKSLYLLVTLLPFAIASPATCECALVKCPGAEPAQCECRNASALRCYEKCGVKPDIKKCPTRCGSRGLPPCAQGQTCIPNPTTPGCDPKADCPGLCVYLKGPFCGGFGALACPDPDQTCVDSPNGGCDTGAGGADCGGICVFLDGRKPPAPQAPAKCGGLAGLTCPKKTQVCVDDPRDGCDPKKDGRDCIGICVEKKKEKKSSPLVTRATKFTSCGGFTGKTCPKAGQKCVDDPRDSCDPKHAADCPGICVGAACGGFAGTPCKAGDTCVDDPRDTCDPAHQGNDCIGVCI